MTTTTAPALKCTGTCGAEWITHPGAPCGCGGTYEPPLSPETLAELHTEGANNRAAGMGRAPMLSALYQSTIATFRVGDARTIEAGTAYTDGWDSVTETHPCGCPADVVLGYGVGIEQCSSCGQSWDPSTLD